MSQQLKTNEQLIRAFLKDLHTVEVALLRERLQKISELTRQAISIDPKAFRSPFTHENDWLNLCNKIDKHLGNEKIKTISDDTGN